MNKCRLVITIEIKNEEEEIKLKEIFDSQEDGEIEAILKNKQN